MDRLSALLARFKLEVALAKSGDANLFVMGGDSDQGAERIIFFPVAQAAKQLGAVVLLAARVRWGGDDNPLLAALPARLSMAVNTDPATANLVRLMIDEADRSRCGVASVLSRLVEVSIIRLLRAGIEQGSTDPGLLAGLADPRISKAIVAIHEHPGRNWRNDALADVAGLSLSRFAEVFFDTLGQTPQAYLRRWRMTLAHQDIGRGDSINAVARRYGYTSSEALARAFRRQFGVKPMAARQAA